MSELWVPPGTPNKEGLCVPRGEVRGLYGEKGEPIIFVGLGDFPIPDSRDGAMFATFDGPYKKNALRVIVSLDTNPHGDLLHVSLSHHDHLPSWESVRMVKGAFFGDVDACMLLPKAEDYVNFHPYTFHLWQLPVRWGIQ